MTSMLMMEGTANLPMSLVIGAYPRGFSAVPRCLSGGVMVFFPQSVVF